jgi:sugar lactone lactonase YvrE
VAATGGSVTLLATGFIAPLNLVVSTDDSTLYIVDTGFEFDDATALGTLFTLSTGGGTPAELTATRGYQPRAIDLVDDGGTDRVYFSGTKPGAGAGVFSFAADATSTIVDEFEGAPLVGPSGVAAHSDGKIYVAETVGYPDTGSGVYELDGTTATAIAGVRVGYPAGIALTESETHLLVSGLDPLAASAAVYRIDLNDNSVTSISSGISQNTESAGVHRAHNADTYAWANADDPGTVYLITTD